MGTNWSQSGLWQVAVTKVRSCYRNCVEVKQDRALLTDAIAHSGIYKEMEPILQTDTFSTSGRMRFETLSEDMRAGKRHRTNWKHPCLSRCVLAWFEEACEVSGHG